jgi:hypothetical protein
MPFIHIVFGARFFVIGHENTFESAKIHNCCHMQKRKKSEGHYKMLLADNSCICDIGGS